ncbi:MAG: plastocyanin/azurin family copper-binding protein [Pirellulales bacterium]
MGRRLFLRALVVALILAGISGPALLRAATVNVRVYGFDFSSGPKGQKAVDPVIDIGDTIHWVWESGGHNVQSVKGSIETFKSAILPSGSTYDYTFNNPGQIIYICLPHGTDLGNGKATGMSGSVTVTYPGDANVDFKVDLADFAILEQYFSAGTTRGEGDFDHNGKVDLNDFGILKDNFGRSTAVPEPASMTLLALGAAAWLTHQRRRRGLQPGSNSKS